jgi:predicted NBD/HSP70 family sugar kinase
MKHYAGLDLSMETTQVCIVDENGRKLVSEKVRVLRRRSPRCWSDMVQSSGR